MTEDRAFSFKLSNFVDRFSANSTDMTKKGANIAPSKLKATAAAQGQGKGQPEDSSRSRQIMENFVQTTTTGVTTPQKRNRPEDDQALDRHAKRTEHAQEDENEEAREEEWQEELRNNIAKEVGLTDVQVSKVMSLVMEAFKVRVVQEARKAAIEYLGTEHDSRRSLQSIIIHRADSWVGKEGGPLNLNLAERVTRAIHAMSDGSLTVLDAYTLGRWDSPTPSSAVLVVFGSRTQKTTFFKILARRAPSDPQLREISCRDAFPKKYVHAAKDLAQRGSTLRTQGKIASFRIVARGNGCFPVLEVKGRDEQGRKETRWRVYVHEERGEGGETRLLARPGSAPATPGKLLGISRLSTADRPKLAVPQPRGASGNIEQIETIPLHLSDEEVFFEPY